MNIILARTMPFSLKMVLSPKSIFWREKGEYANSGVYFIKPVGKPSPIKIGRSCDIKRRLTEVKRNPFEMLEVVCVCKFELPAKLEAAFHQVFHLRRIYSGSKSTEWFNITVTDVTNLLSSSEVLDPFFQLDRSSPIRFNSFLEPKEYQRCKIVKQIESSNEDTLLCLLLELLDPAADNSWGFNVGNFLGSLIGSQKQKKMYKIYIEYLHQTIPLIRHVNFYFLSKGLLLDLFRIKKFIRYADDDNFKNNNPYLYTIFESETIEEARSHHFYEAFLIPESHKPNVSPSRLFYSTLIGNPHSF